MEPKNPIFIEKVLPLMNAVANGETTKPRCPYCDSPGLIFSFTHPKPNKYGLIIFCSNCRNHAHARFIKRPSGFDERFVLKELQKTESEVVNLAERLLDDDVEI